MSGQPQRARHIRGGSEVGSFTSVGCDDLASINILDFVEPRSRRDEVERFYTHYALVPWTVRKFVARHRIPRRIRSLVDFDDLLQWGAIGLLHALRRYDEDRGKFSSYAVRCIRGIALRGLRVQVSGKASGTLSSFLESVRFIDPVLRYGSDLRVLLDLREGHETDPLMRAIVVDESRAFSAMVDSLDDTKRDVIRRRLLGETLDEIGGHLGCSRERVRQIQCKAFLVLGRKLRSRDRDFSDQGLNAQEALA